MSIHFQSLRSSSAGNCLALWTATSSVLIDCGITVQRDCRQLLDEHRRRAGHLDAVIVTHAHGDHMAYGALRVLAREGIPVLADAHVANQLRDRHRPDQWKRRPDIRAFPRSGFSVGDFCVTPIEVPHAPNVPNFAFVVSAAGRMAIRTLVVCTDLHDYAGILPHVAGADFVFIEANHDLELLRQHPNPNSRYHLNNVKTAQLLHHAVCRGATAPRVVMLAHLSEERNRPARALDEVARMFAHQGTRMPFRLDAAPARRASEVVEL